ncbi:MAG: hypothetical protein P1Q69_13900 [Candidatus Thorarchaeota archaeon]|nr:hypothetical protein [Candidatus Thorarchaeota archaeon]
MSAKKQYFDEPIVRIGIEDARFPRICPICGMTADHPARIWASPKERENPRYNQTAKARILSKGAKTLLVYVCEDHYQSDDGLGNSRLVCTLGNGIMISLLVFAILIAGSDLWSGRPINNVFYLVVLSFLLVVGLSVFTFNPGPLASSIKVIGFDIGFQNMWLQFKRSDYRERFVEENAMRAELVSWIAKL